MRRWRVLAALGVWAALVVALWVSDARPAALVLGGVVAVLATAVFVLVDLVAGISRVQWTQRSQSSNASARLDRPVESLRRQARSAWLTGSTQVNDTLVELIDDRLLAHHRIDRRANPVLANETLTPALRHLVAGHRRPVTAARDLRQILTDIEAL
mgnify:FL=1